MEKFKKDLEYLLNVNCIDALCSTPDYELAEMICNYLQEIRIKKDFNKCKDLFHKWNMTWKDEFVEKMNDLLKD